MRPSSTPAAVRGASPSWCSERLPRGRVVAVDGSPSMAAKARERLATERVECSARTSSSCHWPPPWTRDLDSHLPSHLRPTKRCSRESGPRCAPAPVRGAMRRQGQHRAARALGAELASREPYAHHLGRHRRPLALTRRSSRRARGSSGRVRSRRLLARAQATTPPRPREFLETVILRAVSRAAAARVP